MNRFLSLILASMLAIAITGCEAGNDADDNDAATTPAGQTDTGTAATPTPAP